MMSALDLAAVTCVAMLTAAGGVAAQQHASVGETATFAFRRPLLGGEGAASLDDFRGRPVYIEFWGTR